MKGARRPRWGNLGLIGFSDVLLAVDLLLVLLRRGVPLPKLGRQAVLLYIGR